MASIGGNTGPVSPRSKVAHLPGQKIEPPISGGSGRDFTVEFDDALMSQDGWRNPRDRGCKLTSLEKNKFSEVGTPIQYGTEVHRNIQHLAPFSQSWTGDINMDNNPVVQTSTTTIFYGETIAGWQEDKRYPNVGPDFSYVFITKAYTFNPTTNEFFITEMLDPDDEVFERVVKQDLRYGDRFSVQLLSKGVEHDLDDEYTVHWNQGLFAKIASWESCSEIPYSHPQQLLSIYLSKNDDLGYYGSTQHFVSESAKIQWFSIFDFNTNRDNQNIVTGSFTVEKNRDTWWWRRPQTSSYFDISGTGIPRSYSASGDTNLIDLKATVAGTSSIQTFMMRLMSEPHEYWKAGKPGIPSSSWHRIQQDRFGTPPAQKDLHIMTFNGAAGCEKNIQTEIKFEDTTAYTGTNNTTQALRHFGSVSLSQGGLMGVPNIDRGWVNATSNQFFYTTTGGPAFDDYVIENTWNNGGNGWEVSYYNWMGSVVLGDKTYASDVWRPTLFGNKITGSDVLNDIPSLDSWVISKLEKRKNVIMADINKQAQLFEGTGNSGFIIIPDNLHPTIKTNLPYYLKRANLVDKGPRRKNPFVRWPRIIRRPRALRPSFLNPFRLFRRKLKRFRWF